MNIVRRVASTATLIASALTGAVLIGSPAHAAGSAYGCDYSYARPSANTLNNNGCSWVARYLAGNGKGVRAGEARSLHSQGRSVVLNWEGTGREVLGGWSSGVRAAKDAAYWRSQIGAPSTAPIIFSVDFDLNNSGLVVSWLNGAASVLGGRQFVGVYGSYRVVMAAYSAGYVNNWQTYAWSRGAWAPGYVAPLRQIRNGIAGGSLDLDIQVGNYPLWRPNGSVANGPAPTIGRGSPAPASSTGSAHPTVRLGSRGSAVSTLQRAIGVPADGVFGRQTDEKVRQTQRAHHLTADGIVGPRTWSVLLGAPAPKAAPATVTYRLRSGDTVGSVARRYGTTVSRIVALNHLRNPNRVSAGQTLRIR